MTPAESAAAPPCPARDPWQAWNDSPGYWKGLAALALALAVFTVAGCLGAPFTTYDDTAQVVDNKLLRPGAGWLEPFYRFHYAQYIPLTIVSFRANFELFGRDAAWSFRLVNALLHAGSGLLLAALLIRLGLSRLEAAFAALAWTAHPMACESVAWITERSNVLAVCFGLAGLYGYICWHATGRGTLAGLAGFLCALLSKPSALGWLPVFVALELLGGPAALAGWAGRKDATGGPGGGRGQSALRLLPFALLAAAFTGLGISRITTAMLPPPGGHWYYGLATDFAIFPRYLFNLLAPFWLSPFYLVDEIVSADDPLLYLYAVLLAALVGGSLRLARSPRRAIFGWLWFFGGLGPCANILTMSFLMQDRYIYLSAPGALLVLVEVAQGARARLAPDAAGRAGRLLPAAAALYVLLLGALAFSWSFTWTGARTIFSTGVDRQPRCGLARVFLGNEIARSVSDLDRPGPEFDPEVIGRMQEAVYVNLGTALLCTDTYRYFDPLYFRTHLARAALYLGRWPAAKETLKPVLPPVDPPGGPTAGLSEGMLALGFRNQQVGPYVYTYRLRTLASAYQLRAEVELYEALSQPVVADVRAGLERATHWLEEAAKHDPALAESTFSAARVALAEDGLEPPPIPPPAPGVLNAAAVERLVRAAPALWVYLHSEPVRRSLAPPVPPGRARALAYLALAEQDLRDACRSAVTPEDARHAAEAGLRNADRALTSDPTWDAVPWVQARLHLRHDELAERAGDLAGSHRHFQLGRALLVRIGEASPFRAPAQELLRTLKPPPPLPAPQEPAP